MNGRETKGYLIQFFKESDVRRGGGGSTAP